ncbi:MAG: DUF4190 domain-containing protein [Candidatus Acidiferrum sp.]
MTTIRVIVGQGDHKTSGEFELNRNSIASILFGLVLPAFVVIAVGFGPINPSDALVVACLFSPLVAVSFGVVARRQIRKSNQRDAPGTALAIAGLTLGCLGIVFCIGTATINLAVRPAPYAASAVGSLRTLNFATHVYAKAHPQQGFPKKIEDLVWDPSDSENTWGIDRVLASGVKSHYRFTYIPRSTKNDGLIDAYQIFADPIDAEEKDSRHFYTDQSESIRMSRGAPANEKSAELK